VDGKKLNNKVTRQKQKKIRLYDGVPDVCGARVVDGACPYVGAESLDEQQQ